MRHLTVLIAVCAVAAGCAAMKPAPMTATAELRNAQGQPVGTATLTDVGGGVRVIVEARNLPPGDKGVHIHEVGRCEPPFTTAGGHFNPGKRQHGLQNPAGPHAGDLPNITIGADGTGRLETVTDRVTLGGGATSLFDADGSAIVIHAAPDDHRTDPAGNSGARIACGVIVRK
ncbi:MAG TPA: superoxide dismutase family protein [Calidithermus sp.]|jgi:Cu-Zn family superoxide dismutase|nr:superoxide dismutase family protein [Calidithermus sp.]